MTGKLQKEHSMQLPLFGKGKVCVRARAHACIYYGHVLCLMSSNPDTLRAMSIPLWKPEFLAHLLG